MSPESIKITDSRIWSKVTSAIKAGNQTLATTEKTRIEENQRLLKSNEVDAPWCSRFFHMINEKWELKIMREYFIVNV